MLMRVHTRDISVMNVACLRQRAEIPTGRAGTREEMTVHGQGQDNKSACHLLSC